MSGAFGNTIKQADLDAGFLTGPGESIVSSTLMQMAAASNGQSAPAYPFAKLFGPYKPATAGKDQPQQQRWADYSREDWSIRSLPALNVYEADTEQKTASNGWLMGTINFMAIWPASQRRSDWSRVANAFKGAIENFFESHFCSDMLDEHFSIRRPMKVPGLNEYGKDLSWTPNVEGIVEGQLVPVTLISVKYRLDLRSWYRELEYQNRTKEIPFGTTLSDLNRIAGEYDGNTQAGPNPQVVIPDSYSANQGNP